MLDIGNLSTEAGVDSRTAKRWLSILQASFIIFLVQPYYRNFNKRLVKRIEVKGFEVRNFRGTDSYMYLESIVLSPKKPPMAKRWPSASGAASCC